MVPIHAQRVRDMSGPGHSGNTAATTADFISPSRNTAQDFGNTATLAWLS
jgi:hypothetical protein